MYNKVIKKATAFLLGVCIFMTDIFPVAAANITIPQGSTGNREYTANYSPVEYVITFDTDGGNELKDKTYTIETEDFKLPTPSKTGHTFKGWTGSNGTTPQLDVNIPKGTTGNKNFKAVWNANKYTYNIEYKSESGKLLGTDNVTAEFGSTVTIDPKNYEGYLTPDKQNILFDKAYEYTITFTYTPLEYNVTYHVDDGKEYNEKIKTDYSLLKPKSFVPKKSGWIFVGWSNSDSEYEALTELSMSPAYDGHHLYAIFKQDVTVSFDSLTSEGTINTQDVIGTKYCNNGNVKNAEIIVPEPDESYESTNYIFRGWSDLNDAAADATVSKNTEDTIFVTEDSKVYALYERTNTLTYDGNEADSGSVESQSGTEYKSASLNTKYPAIVLAENNFVKAKYKFTGWDLGVPGETIYLTESKITKAQWLYCTNMYYEATFRSTSTGKFEYIVKKYRWYTDGTKELISTNNCQFNNNYEDDYFSVTYSDILDARYSVRNKVSGTMKVTAGTYNKKDGAIIPYTADNDCIVTFLTDDIYED